MNHHFLVFMTTFRYLIKIRYFKVRGLLAEKDNLVTSGDLTLLIKEILILLIQPYPFFQGTIFNNFISNFIAGIKIYMYNDVEGREYFYHINDLFNLLTIIRLYTLLRFLMNNTIYRTPRARRVS